MVVLKHITYNLLIRKIKKLKWVATPVLLVLALLVTSEYSYPSSSSQLQLSEHQKLQNEKLRQEIRKLQRETEKLNSFWDQAPSYASIITAIVAVVGVLFTVRNTNR